MKTSALQLVQKPIRGMEEQKLACRAVCERLLKVMKTISEELKEAFHKIDLLQRPYILYVNPAQKEKFVQALKETEYYDRMVVQETSCVEIDKAYIMERKKLDDWMIPKLKIVTFDERKEEVQ